MNYRSLTMLTRDTARALAVAIALTSIAVAAPAPFSKLVTFGDSLSDTGNAYLLTGGYYPTCPPNFNGRISNGPLWTEHLAATLGMKLRPEDQYAVAGARTDDGSYLTNFGLLTLENTGLQTQIDAYLQNSGPAGADPNALHTVWIGANDIFTTLAFGGDMNLTVTLAVQNTAQAVYDLASHGARHILVADLPDLGLTPFGLALGASYSAQLSYLTDAYNAGLGQALDALDAAGIETIRLDAAGLIRDIAADPAAYGLVNASDQASLSADDADGYLFWNEVHPTSAGHRLVAAQAFEELIAFYAPSPGHGKKYNLLHALKEAVKDYGRPKARK